VLRFSRGAGAQIQDLDKGQLASILKTMKKMRFPDFSNKFVSLSIAGDDHCYTMESPSFESQGGRIFLVGIVPRGGSKGNWSEGAGCAIAWDCVTDYLVFDSAKQYRKRLAQFEKHKTKD